MVVRLTIEEREALKRRIKPSEDEEEDESSVDLRDEIDDLKHLLHDESEK